MLIPFRCQYYYRFLSQKTCLVSFSTKNNARMLHSVSVSSSNSPSRTGLRLLSGSASAENLKDGSKKDPRYDEDFIDIENTKPYVKNPNIQVTERCENIFKEILQLNSVDVILLLQLLKERTGMDPYSDPSGDGLTFAGGKRKGAGVSTAEGAAPVVEKTVFELKLAGFDEKSKIKIIKEIRAITGLGLKEAKELVEGAPKIVKKDIKKAEAEELKGKLEAVGAVVEIV